MSLIGIIHKVWLFVPKTCPKPKILKSQPQNREPVL